MVSARDPPQEYYSTADWPHSRNSLKSLAEQYSRGVYHIEVNSEFEGQRLDNFLLRSLKGVPRSHVYRLIRSGQIRVNSGRAHPSYRLKLDDLIRVPPVSQRSPTERKFKKEDTDWLVERIIYEDSRILVLDKPSGVAVHGGSGISLGCIEALRCLKPNLPSLELIHRLDRGTSGCLLVAKRRSALRRIHQLLREGQVRKNYLALVEGAWQGSETDVDFNLTANRRKKGETFVRVDSEGKPAHSRFCVIERYQSGATLMEVSTTTGRTHQIRVHAAHMGHTVAGDERYGNQEFNLIMKNKGLHRLFLHALSISFVWPQTEEEFFVSASLPDELGQVLGRVSASR